MECFRCGVSEKNEKLLEVIHGTGIVHVCIRCYPKVRLPIVQKKNIDMEDVLKRKTLKEQFDSKPRSNNLVNSSYLKRTSSEDMSLREIVERNFNENKIEKSETPEDLVDNFNWAIMRRRRAMKISQIELSQRIGEPEVIVHALENGTLPKDYAGLIKKVENVLGIRLFREKKLGSVDILSEARVPGGILIEEVKEKLKKPFSFNIFKKKDTEDLDLDLEDLDLDKVNDIVGVPEEDVVKPKKVEKKVDKKTFSDLDFDDDALDSEIASGRNGEDLGPEDISKIIWGK